MKTNTTTTTENQSFFIYQDATDRFNHGKSSPTDELIMALWEEVQEQAEKLRQQALKISYLEMKEQQPAAAGEYTDLLSRLSRP